MARSLLAALAAVLLSGCSGSSCGELPGLRAERDEQRQAYLELARSATPEQTEQADEELHALERQVYDLEQSC